MPVLETTAPASAQPHVNLAKGTDAAGSPPVNSPGGKLHPGADGGPTSIAGPAGSMGAPPVTGSGKGSPAHASNDS